MNAKTLFPVLVAAIAMGLAFPGPAQAVVSISGTVTYYSDFTENYGSGISFDSPFASESFTYISDTADYYGTNSQALWLNGNFIYGADFVGTIDAPSTGNYDFSFGVDDAGYVFVDGSSTPNSFIGGGNDLLGSGSVRDITLVLNAGSNPFELQYANENADQAALVFTAGAVPEVSTWAMMLLGFAGLGFAAFRRAAPKGDVASLV